MKIFFLFFAVVAVASADLATIAPIGIPSIIIPDIMDEEIGAFDIHNIQTGDQLTTLELIPEGSGVDSFTQTDLTFGGTELVPTTTVCQMYVVCQWLNINLFLGANTNTTADIFGDIQSQNGSGDLWFEVWLMVIKDSGNNFHDYGQGVTSQTETFGSDSPEPATMFLIGIGLLCCFSRKKKT